MRPISIGIDAPYKGVHMPPSILMLVSLLLPLQSQEDPLVRRQIEAELKKAMTREAKQPPPEYAMGEKVVAYGTGLPVPGYSSFEGLAVIAVLFDKMTTAKMQDNAEVYTETSSQLMRRIQSLRESGDQRPITSGTLFEVTRSRWVETPKRTGFLKAFIPAGVYAYELRCMDPESPARDTPTWISGRYLVPATKRLLPPLTTTRLDRSMQLSTYFGEHQREDIKPDTPSGGVSSNSSPPSRSPSPTPAASSSDTEPLGKPATAARSQPEEELSIELIDHNDGVSAGTYRVFVEIRNTSRKKLMFLQMTILYRSAGNKLLHTKSTYSSPNEIEPGETATFQATTFENVDEIDHYNLKFEADGRAVKYTKRAR
jgi:hypothetical protein